MDLIIGAGISGLTYAAFTSSDYLVLEREPEMGGYCRTIKQDGFTWDYSGHFFHFTDDNIRNLVLGKIDPEKLLHVVKKTQIQYKDRKIDFPFQKNIHQLPQDEFIDCLYDLFQNPYKDSGDFQKMLYAKFGRSIAEKFLIPYNSKLYACDLNTLEPDAMGRFFPYANKEEIIANFKNPVGNTYNSSFLYPKDGAYEYVRSISSTVGKSRILLNEDVQEIDMRNHRLRTAKGEYRYDRLISTMPFPLLLNYCGIPYEKHIYSANKVLVFNIGFNKKGHEQTNHWIYYPEKKYIFYRVGFYDNIFGEDRLSVYVEIGYKQEDEVDIDSAFARTINDLREAGIISEHEIVSKCSIMMDPAYVHISKGMEKDRVEKMELLKANDIYSIGRYGKWTYCSIEDNIKEAIELAGKLSE